MKPDEPALTILFEHPEWQQPLFEALERRRIPFRKIDLKEGAVGGRLPRTPVYFNQASPSAHVRNHAHAVPFALALMEYLETRGARVINGARAFRLELSKLAQVALMQDLGIPHPRTWAFNHPGALDQLRDELVFPAVLKPNLGGSGARMHRVESFAELERLVTRKRDLWTPDPVLLVQEFLPHRPERDGIVRLEFLGGELLYAMRVISAGEFNLCPSEVCNPAGRQGPQFLPCPEVPAEAVASGRRILNAAGIEVGAVEYLETAEGRRVFYDVNANSNLRRSVGEYFGFNPFDRVADFLDRQVSRISAVA